MEIYPNTAYCRLTLKIKKAGKGRIIFRNAESGETRECSFPVRERTGERPRKITPADVVYLLMPDRFADGDTANNAIPGHKDPVRRDHRWGRRGGDLQGVMEHLDYLEELGITALWMTPVYENDYINCYHGYTPTDTYGVEPFLGSLQLYGDLVSACRERGIKVIMDHIVNHVAPSHPIAQDPPSPEWINGSIEDHENCNYRIMDITDIYGPAEQCKLPTEGWFAGYLADMNMRHPAVVDYWITHAVWWVESAGVDGIRQDTYAYSDLGGMRRWAKELKREYQELFIVGEIMEFDRTRMAYFFNAGQENHLSSVTDFPFSSLIYQLIAEGLPLEDFYREVANDFIYRDPDMMMTFMDNHDMPRFYSAVGGGLRDYLNAWTLLFSMRGIPQIYYGDEIGMSGDHDPDNRKVFPGGFPDAQRNAFSAGGRTERENRIFGQFKAFTLLRKEHPELFLHPMRHDLRNGVYLVWRSDGVGNALLTAYNPGGINREVSYSRLESRVRTAYREIKAPLEGAAHIDPGAARIFVPAGETVSWLLR
jgi:glycosidase